MNSSRPVPRESIEARLEEALPESERGGLGAAREAVAAFDDRWFGQFAIASYRSVAGTGACEPALPAATAIELLRGYSRIRTETFVRLADDRAHAHTRDPTAALLAGDYLYTSAYRSLAAVDHPALGDCFDAMTDVLAAMTDAFTATYVEASAASTGASFFEGAAGSLGAGAGALGATLGGADAGLRDAVARLGRGLGTARGIQQRLDGDAGHSADRSVVADEQVLRERATEHRAAARDALRTISAAVPVDPLEPVLGPLRSPGAVDPSLADDASH